MLRKRGERRQRGRESAGKRKYELYKVKMIEWTD